MYQPLITNHEYSPLTQLVWQLSLIHHLYTDAVHPYLPIAHAHVVRWCCTLSRARALHASKR